MHFCGDLPSCDTKTVCCVCAQCWCACCIIRTDLFMAYFQRCKPTSSFYHNVCAYESPRVDISARGLVFMRHDRLLPGLTQTDIENVYLLNADFLASALRRVLEHFTLEMLDKDLETNPCRQMIVGRLCRPLSNHLKR